MLYAMLQAKAPGHSFKLNLDAEEQLQVTTVEY